MVFWRRSKTRKYRDIAPEDIFLDAHNLPDFNKDQFEGQIEKPIHIRTLYAVIFAFAVIVVLFLLQLWKLQIHEGSAYLAQSETNRLGHEVVIADRGEIHDRNGIVLARNDVFGAEENDFLERRYATSSGLAHILGYVSYPKKDSAGFYFQDVISGEAGVEEFYDELLSGENGRTIVETNARGDVISSSTIKMEIPGETLVLSLDARIQERLYEGIRDLAADVGFTGGASVFMDITNGEILALASFPEYDIQKFTDRDDVVYIQDALGDERMPFLNRAIGGLYTPGSVIKPFVAVGALDQDVISPETEIYSSGRLVVPNRFNPDQPTIFNDWKEHGYVDLRSALAVSSNVYFFQVGGGFEDQKGIGIAGVEEYARMFGIAEPVGIDLFGEEEGIIPNPEWKETYFPNDPWRVGDTYNTSIGQYGFQVTPLQMVRAVGAIANGGILVDPHLRLRDSHTSVGRVSIDDEILQIVREGMREAVTDGTAKGLAVPGVEIAAKTGTAELGNTKERVNSWVMGFFPYENPRYAFATVMEQGPAQNLIGSLFVMRQLFDWMIVETPEYFDKN